MQHQEFENCLLEFLLGAQAKVTNYYEQNFPKLETPKIVTMRGPKYIRVVRQEQHTRSVYCFIDYETGRIWKGAGWKAPERKNPRSSIYDADYGLSGVTSHGVKYLR